MTDVLEGSNRDVLVGFAASNGLVAFDFDGTLAPIVSEPARARMRPETRDLLADLARLYPCVVVSGRARSDLVERLEGIPLRGLIGNHGLEYSETSSELAREVARWRPQLEEKLSGFAGVRIEDKSFSISVHYRHVRESEKEAVRTAILEAADSLGEVRVIGGLEVVNLLPSGSPHKGTALVAERERLRCETAIYVGDDETDEDVFTLDESARVLTIRVGPSSESAAKYSIASQTEIDELLRVLVAARRETRAARGL